jgi:hypothetical protein
MVGALIGLGAVLMPSASASTALPAGGGQGPGATFETPVVTPGRFRSVPAGQRIGPWTVTGRDVDLIGANFWQAADGVQSVDLEGSAVPNFQGGVKRTFDTAALPLPLFHLQAHLLCGRLDGQHLDDMGNLAGQAPQPFVAGRRGMAGNIPVSVLRA